jgi:ribosomal protein S27AE
MNRFLNDKKKMELKEAIQLLKDHNIWRRYDGEISESPKMTDPKKLGIAIDTVVNEFENLFICGVSKSVAAKDLKCPKCKKHDLMKYIDRKECTSCGYVC